jgi:hypothetical protein
MLLYKVDPDLTASLIPRTRKLNLRTFLKSLSSGMFDISGPATEYYSVVKNGCQGRGSER